MQNNIDQTNDTKCQDKNEVYLDIYNQIIDTYSHDTVIDIEIQHQCGICFEDFDERKISILEKCEHIFHKKCLENNARKDFPHDFICPMCENSKTQIKKENLSNPKDTYSCVIFVKIIITVLFCLIMASIFLKML
jgi:hypothetical protein